VRFRTCVLARFFVRADVTFRLDFVAMEERALGTTRMILYAAARVLGCGSVQLAMVDDDKRSLVFTTSITNRDLPRLERVELEMGFQLEGARLPLAAEGSTLVRAYRDERLIVTHDPGELAGGILPDDTLAAIREAIGPRTFAVVPVVARVGTIGVLLFEKPDETGFTPEDRDLLVAYADRVGADLESQALSDDVRRLESLEPGSFAPPILYACNRQLVVVGGHDEGRLLSSVLAVPESSLKDALALASSVHSSTVTVRSGGRQMRITLMTGPGDLVLAAAEDLSAAENLRREAARAREHLAKVLRSVDDAILTLDADGRIASVNEAVTRALGYGIEELTGREIFELCGDERSQKRAHDMRPRLRSSGFAEAELRFRRKDGTTFIGEVSALLLADDEERPAGVLWRVHDLTERRRGDAERKRLRARLLHTERLSALGEMAARIAHEVRNPLVSIGAAAQVVAEETGGDSPVAPEVQAIVREVKRLDNIVSDFLRFARPRRVERKSVDLSPVVNESVDLVRVKAPHHQLLITVEPPVIARCDPDGVKQVLLNVLLNAVEASPSTAPNNVIELEARVAGDAVELSIADRGPGVPSSARSRVFDPFFSTKTRGTGLGLAVSKQIIDEHQGRIRLLNRRGGGTRVVIELPIG
jgi:PAS domain S-box-containing protein